MNETLSFRGVLEPDGLKRDRRIVIGPGGTIESIGPGEAPYDGFLALPGMPNAHSHAFQRALAGRGEAAHGGDSFWTWREAMYGLANSVSAEDVYAIARQAYTEMLRGGFTHVVEFHYLYHARGGARAPEMTDAVVRAAEDVGLPMSLLPVYYRTAGFDERSAAAEQCRFVHRTVGEFLEMLSGLGSRASGVAPHSLRAVPARELAALVAGVDEVLGADVPLHIHVSEQTAEVKECKERFGTTPIELLFDHVEPGPRWNLVHATHATLAEREAVRAAGSTVVLCPLTEAYLGDGVFQAREHVRMGGAIGIGTDSNVRISAIEELRMLEYGQRLRDRMRARLATTSGVGAPLWQLAAIGGAGAAAQPIGRIAPGSRADFVVLDDEAPLFAGHDVETAADAWLVGGGSPEIASVFVAGDRVVEHGAVTADAETAALYGRAMTRLRTGG